MPVLNMEFLQIRKFFLLDKICKMDIKLHKFRDPSCYDINVACILSPKDDLLKFLKFEFRHVSSF